MTIGMNIVNARQMSIADMCRGHRGGLSPCGLHAGAWLGRNVAKFGRKVRLIPSARPPHTSITEPRFVNWPLIGSMLTGRRKDWCVVAVAKRK